MTREERIEAALGTVGKTTPGPWEIDGWYIVGGDGSTVAHYIPWDESGCREEDIANRNVLSAACDLREEVIALRQLAKTVPRAMLKEVT
jgi:hypothetical protein